MDNGLESPIEVGEERPDISKKWVPTINAIASQGLKSAAQLHTEGTQFYPSDDEHPRDYIAGITLNPFPPEDKEAIDYLQRRLYADAESVIPVILERPGEKRTYYDSVRATPRNEFRQECERRAQASFLIVCKRTRDDFSSPSTIPSESFDYVLFPKAVHEQYMSDKSRIEFPSNVKVQVVNEMVKRLVEDQIDMELNIPNYEQALLDILKTEEGSIFVHGVRLPLDGERVLFKRKNRG